MLTVGDFKEEDIRVLLYYSFNFYVSLKFTLKVGKEKEFIQKMYQAQEIQGIFLHKVFFCSLLGSQSFHQIHEGPPPYPARGLIPLTFLPAPSLLIHRRHISLFYPLPLFIANSPVPFFPPSANERACSNSFPDTDSNSCAEDEAGALGRGLAFQLLGLARQVNNRPLLFMMRGWKGKREELMLIFCHLDPDARMPSFPP